MKKFSPVIGLIVGLTLCAGTLFYSAYADKDRKNAGDKINDWLNKTKPKPAATSTPVAAPTPSARVDKLTGEVRVLRAGETDIAPLEKGDELFVGDVVMTREDSSAQIMGSTVKGRRLMLSVDAGAIIVITKLHEDEEEEQRFFRMLQGGGGVTAEDFPKQTAAGSPRIGKKKKDYTTSSAIDMSDR